MRGVVPTGAARRATSVESVAPATNATATTGTATGAIRDQLRGAPGHGRGSSSARVTRRATSGEAIASAFASTWMPPFHRASR